MLTHQKDGIVRGTGGLVLLSDKKEHQNILIKNASAHYSFSKGNSKQKYPTSLMGSIALLRQTFLDANWYGKAIEKNRQFPQENPPIKNNKDLDILSSWIHENRPFIFETNHELSTLRSFNVSDEFQLNSWIRGSGYEYRRISTIAKVNPFIILPLDFPTTPDIADPYEELSYSTSELKHWDMAADNPALLFEEGISIAFTAYGLKGKEFRKNLSRSVERGLSETNALAALTTIPAEKMGKGGQLGRIKKGYLANLSILSGNYFNNKSKVVSVWVGGEEYPVMPKYDIDITGEWKVTMGKKWYQLELKKNNKWNKKELESYKFYCNNSTPSSRNTSNR